MLKLILKWIIAATAVLVASYLVPGITVSGISTAFIVALILGIFSITIKPIIKLITLPLSLLTFGLFALVINAALFYLASVFIDGFAAAGFWPAFLGSLVVSVVTYLGDKILEKDENDIL